MAVENRYAPSPDPDAGRVRLGMLLSTVFAGAVLYGFADLYLFAKVLHVPAWMDAWAPARLSGGVALLIALLPAALLPRTGSGAAKAILVAAALAPLSAVALWVSRHAGVESLVMNAAFQYVWVLAWACAIPVGVLLGLVLLAYRFDRRQRG